MALDTDDFARVKEVFLFVRDLPRVEQGPAIDAALLDPALRAEVRELLGHDDEDAPFIRPPDPDAAPPAPPEDPPPPLVGQTLEGRFEVEVAIAEGGFGWVFRGGDLQTGEAVAIKLFKPIDDPGLRAEVEAAFDREGRVLESLAPRSMNIVAYRDVGTWTDAEGVRRSFIVMEWLDGVTLAEHVNTRYGEGPLPLATVYELLTPIADALTIAHRSGVAHRDIKPSNILAAPPSDDPDGEPILKLVDFGAAKRAADRARGFQSTGGQVGMITFDYSAPEQVNKAYGSTGPWSDVFSLAVLCVEMCAGRHPWRHLDLLTAMDRATDKQTRPTPRTMGVSFDDPAVDDAVEALFVRALAVEHARRPADAETFWAAFGAALRGEAPAQSTAEHATPEAASSGASLLGYVYLIVGLGALAGLGWWLLR